MAITAKCGTCGGILKNLNDNCIKCTAPDTEPPAENTDAEVLYPKERGKRIKLEEAKARKERKAARKRAELVD